MCDPDHLKVVPVSYLPKLYVGTSVPADLTCCTTNWTLTRGINLADLDHDDPIQTSKFKDASVIGKISFGVGTPNKNTVYKSGLVVIGLTPLSQPHASPLGLLFAGLGLPLCLAPA